MKKVNVFIASSAELDEDKTRLDLFFSEKNKIYEKRDILFVQRTWKDFESSLHKKFLQERYDEYIRKCDIVLFLLEKVPSGQQSDEDELAHYASLQQLMLALRDILMDSPFVCDNEMQVTSDLTIEWEYDIFGGWNGLSIGLKLQDYE